MYSPKPPGVALRLQGKQTAPHREGYRYAGPSVVVPLQHHTPPDRVVPPNPDLSQAASQSPLLPLDSTSLSLPRKNITRGASPRPSWNSMSRIHFLCRCQSGEQCCPAPQDLCRSAKLPPQVDFASLLHPRKSIRCHVSKPGMSLAPSSDNVPHRVAHQAEQSAAVRCKPSCPTMPLPQAPCSDAVPCRIDRCQATPAAAVRQDRQPCNNPWSPP